MAFNISSTTSDDNIFKSLEYASMLLKIDRFKDLQVDAIKSALKGQNVFVNLPTGYGKGVIFHALPLCADYLRGPGMESETAGQADLPGSCRAVKLLTDDFRSTQWLNFNSNNLGKELLLENIRNRMSRSNPGSRSGSPSLSGGRLLGKPRDAERCSSEPFLDSSAQELHQGYTKYLFGNRETDSGQNVKVPEQRLQPVNPVGDQSCGPCEEVPSSSSIVCISRTGTDCFLDQRSCKLDSNPLKSCQNETDQYLTKMQSLSIRGKQHQGHNWESPKAKAESCSDGTDSRTVYGSKTTKCGVETDITSCNGNREGKMKERIEKDVSLSGPPSDDKESWRDVKHIDKESLPNVPMPELRYHIEKLQSAVNDANSQLVQHLQEKDVLSSEVASRHITIKKLVERQKTLHH